MYVVNSQKLYLAREKQAGSDTVIISYKVVYKRFKITGLLPVYFSWAFYNIHWMTLDWRCREWGNAVQEWPLNNFSQK